MAVDKYHDTDIVPLSERRSPLTMGLVWITMVTGLPCVLAGFEWYKIGLNLSQVIACTSLSCLILLLYAIPANQLGAVSGQSFSILSRSIFGRVGSYLVSINLLWMFLFWYGWAALFAADGLKGLYSINLPTMWLAAGLAILMAVNNFFGFTGVANFARYLAAPVLIAWILFTFSKVTGSHPAAILNQTSHVPFWSAITVVSSFVIGYSAWGNEADYWRYSKPKKLFSAIPVTIALLIGQIIFPATGWMLANMSGVTDSQAAVRLVNEYSLAGIPLLAALVLLATMFAGNDSNLFGTTATIQNLRPMRHRSAVTILALIGAVVAALLANVGVAKSLESVASLNCVIMPTPTVIMLTEWFLATRVLNVPTHFSKIVPLDQLPFVRWPALCALIAGCTVGVVTSNVIPGTAALHVGICPLQAWLTAFLVYVPLRITEYRQSVELERSRLERELVAETVTVASYDAHLHQ